MDSFTGKIAVVTGGGAGMGAELARLLAAEGCEVAVCDVSAANIEDTLARCRADAPPGTRVTGCVADVSAETDLEAFRAHVARAHQTDHIDLLFNNAGIGGGGYSFVAEPRSSGSGCSTSTGAVSISASGCSSPCCCAVSGRGS